MFVGELMANADGKPVRGPAHREHVDQLEQRRAECGQVAVVEQVQVQVQPIAPRHPLSDQPFLDDPVSEAEQRDPAQPRPVRGAASRMSSAPEPYIAATTGRGPICRVPSGRANTRR